MKVVSSAKVSALEKFARWFHQDFFLHFSDVETGGARYLEQLSVSERQAVLLALQELLTEHRGESEKGLRNAWLKLGVQAWPRRDSTRAILQSFVAQSFGRAGQ
jgi:hypothetical protein